MIRIAVLFAFLQGPRLSVVDLHLIATFVLATTGLLSLARRSEHARTVPPLLLAFMPAIAYALLAGLFSGGADFAIASILLKSCLYLVAAIGIVWLYRARPGRDEWDILLLRDVVIVSALNAIFVVAFVVSPTVRAWSATVLDLSQKGHWVETGFRGVDLSMGGGATASIYFATVAIVCARHARSFEWRWFGAAAFVVLAAAALLSGRTGIVLTGVLLPLALWLALRRPIRPVWGSSAAIAGAGLLAGVAVAAGLFMAMSDMAVVVHVRDVVLPWALEGLPVLGRADSGNESLRRIVENMFFMPTFDLQVIAGAFNGGRSQWLPYIASDVGYVRVVHAVGLFGLLLIWLAHMPFVAKAVMGARRSCLAFGVGIGLLVLVITNFKELNLGSRGSGPLLALLTVALASSMSASRSSSMETMR